MYLLSNDLHERRPLLISGQFASSRAPGKDAPDLVSIVFLDKAQQSRVVTGRFMLCLCSYSIFVP